MRYTDGITFANRHVQTYYGFKISRKYQVTRVKAYVFFHFKDTCQNFFVLYEQCFDHNLRVIRRTQKLKKEKSALGYLIKNCVSVKVKKNHA